MKAIIPPLLSRALVTLSVTRVIDSTWSFLLAANALRYSVTKSWKIANAVKYSICIHRNHRNIGMGKGVAKIGI